MAAQFFQVNRGASGNSAVVQRGIAGTPGCGASNVDFDRGEGPSTAEASGGLAVESMRFMPGRDNRMGDGAERQRSPLMMPAIRALIKRFERCIFFDRRRNSLEPRMEHR